MKKILLTNDDGLYSSGLRASYNVLKKLGRVYVITPAIQKSGVGRSISVMEPIRVNEVKINGMRIFAVDGTPTDAVIIGIHEIIGDTPDLVVSGINLGENLSTEAVTTSGTIGAALEAATQGSKAIAISRELSDHLKFESFIDSVDFSNVEKVLELIASKVLGRGLPEGVDLLNVNVPEKWNGKIEFTRLARRLYETRIDVRYDPRGRRYYWIYGIEVENAEPDTDIHALRSGKVSITPISLDMTAKIDFESLKRWFDEA